MFQCQKTFGGGRTLPSAYDTWENSIDGRGSQKSPHGFMRPGRRGLEARGWERGGGGYSHRLEPGEESAWVEDGWETAKGSVRTQRVGRRVVDQLFKEMSN